MKSPRALPLPARAPGPASCTDGASRKTPAPSPNQIAISKGMKIHWAKRKGKYGAKRTQVNGIWFMSKAEATRYAELDLLQKAGKIRHLILQPRYSLTTHGVKIGEYRADFEYQEGHFDPPMVFSAGTVRWHTVAEDVKGFATDLFKWKAKHFRAEYKAITLREIRK